MRRYFQGDDGHLADVAQGRLVGHGTSLALGLKLAQTSLGLFERCGGALALRFDSAQLLAPVALVVGSLRRCVFPWRSAVSDFGSLAQPARSHQNPPPWATGDHVVR